MPLVLPVVRSVGTNAVGTTSATPGLPAGVVEGDLLLTVVASAGEAGTVAQSGFNIIRTVKNGTTTTDSQLTILWKLAGASESATQVTSTANHVSARTIAIQKGTFNPLNPIHAESGGNVQGSTTSVSISGLTTTKDNCLILSFSGASLPDSNSTAQYGSWANSSLTGLAEITDDNTSQGNGGGHGTISGVMATAGTVSATTATKASAALLANLMIAINPIEYIPVSADFSPYQTVIDGTPSGWDAFIENVSCMIKFGSTYFLYYIGGDTDADIGDDWVYNRQVGVATSPDGVNWTKYGSNPILSFTPEGDQPEEGVGDCKCVVYDGKVHMYYSAVRWITGGEVDVEIRYRVSTDGFTFADDTLILASTGDELYAAAAYVTSGGTFHVYYVGPLTGGVGDLKKISGTDPKALSSDGTITTNDYSSRGGIIPLDAETLIFHNDGDFAGAQSLALISPSALGTLGPTLPSLDFDPSATLDQLNAIFFEAGTWWAFSFLGTSESAPYANIRIILRTYPDIPAFELAASSNISASAATNTTAIMSAPGGKTFQAGKISDDTNPLPSLDLGDDFYTEAEWCLQATAVAGAGVVYEFRVSDNGAALDTYTDTPEWTIAAGATEQAIGQTTESDAALSMAKTKRKVLGLATEADQAQAVTEETAIVEAVGLTTETEAAQALTAKKAHAVGLTSETDSVLTLTSKKAKAFGQASEAGLAQALSKVKAKGLGLATETAQGFDLHPIKARALGQTQETDAALATTRQKTKDAGLATETEQAFGVSATKIKAIGLATETGTAQSVAVQGSTLLGLADETDTALAVLPKKVKALGLAIDAESAQALTGRKVRTIGLVSETDQALGVGNAISLLQAVETDSGLPIRVIKTKVLGLAQETSVVFAVATQKHLAMGLVTETQAALALYIEPAVGAVLVRVGATLSIPGHDNETLSIPEHAGESLNIPEQSGATLTV